MLLNAAMPWGDIVFDPDNQINIAKIYWDLITDTDDPAAADEFFRGKYPDLERYTEEWIRSILFDFGAGMIGKA